MVIIKTPNEFSELLNNKKIVVEFGSEWSTPSKMLDIIIEDVEQEKNDIVFVKVDVDRFRLLAKEYNIVNVPVVCLFDDGKVVKQQSGLMRKEELLNFIQQI